MVRVLIMVSIAQRALRHHKLRSVLTMLGVIIGVAAVVAMVAIGQGAQAAIRAKIASLGADSVVVLPGSMTQNGVRYGWGARSNLQAGDVRAIQQECPAVTWATPRLRTGSQVVYANQNWATTVQGTGIEYPLIREWPLLMGSWFTQQDVDAAAKVAVLGMSVREALFGGMDPLGQVLRIQNIPFKVIGVMAPKGQSFGGQDQDDLIVIPYTTAQKKVLGIRYLHSILASAMSGDDIGEAIDQITALLRQRHRLRPFQENDFSVRSLADIAAAEEASSRILTWLLAGIASISLLVGGIGIMNTLLIAVTKRTREIGIRMAVGAKRRDILLQFLTEAVTLSLVGGVVGIGLGAGGAIMLSAIAEWPALISWNAGALAFGVSGLVGIFFGLYPARQASRLEPIQALRYE